MRHCTWLSLFVSVPAMAVPVVPNGYSVEVYASGFQNPNSIAFSPGGTFGYAGQLFVGDSRPSTGKIYRVPAKGNVQQFATAADNEPRSLEFGPIGTSWAGKLYCSHGYSIVSYDSAGQRTQFVSTSAFPWDIAFGPGGSFGTDLYHADGWNEALQKVTPAGVKTTVKRFSAIEINGLAFGPGGAYGSNLYLAFAKGERDATYGGTPAIRQITPSGTVTDFVLDSRFGNTNQLVFDDIGNFGGMLYVADSTKNVIWQITSNGTVSTFASGFNFNGIQSGYHINDGGDIVFGPDGAMYIADGGAKVIYRIFTPEPQTAMLLLAVFSGGLLQRHR